MPSSKEPPIMNQEELQKILSNLRQIVKGTKLLNELKAERQQEINRERQLEQSLHTG
jgi:hypothetical protein